jgi:hypothetical protein
MDITMIGLQNAGKTSLLRVLAVSNDAYIGKSSDQMSRVESSLLSMLTEDNYEEC